MHMHIYIYDYICLCCMCVYIYIHDYTHMYVYACRHMYKPGIDGEKELINVQPDVSGAGEWIILRTLLERRVFL